MNFQAGLGSLGAASHFEDDINSWGVMAAVEREPG